MELSIDAEWAEFISTSPTDNDQPGEAFSSTLTDEQSQAPASYNTEFAQDMCPRASDIYISTKTNIAFMTEMVDLASVFWKIPVIPYGLPQEGVVKKQMKFNSTEQSQVDEIHQNLRGAVCVDQNIITSINNPDARVKFKDVRKVSIGVSKKDIISYRCKKKSAFYNCFVIILRRKNGNVFKEYHVKVFNTGKLEIPGIQSQDVFDEVLDSVIATLYPYVDSDISVDHSKTQTVLINSNFNCGFFINREELFDILRFNYNIECIYDPCTYPGIQCKFYYDTESGVQNGARDANKDVQRYTVVSFMIFRTGSVLIVGRCHESVLHEIYGFLKKLLEREFLKVAISIIDQEEKHNAPTAEKKVRKRFIVNTSTCITAETTS